LDCLEIVTPELREPQSVLAIVYKDCEKGCGGKYLPAFGCYACAKREDRCAKCWESFPYKTRTVNSEEEPLDSEGKDFVIIDGEDK